MSNLISLYCLALVLAGCSAQTVSTQIVKNPNWCTDPVAIKEWRDSAMKRFTSSEAAILIHTLWREVCGEYGEQSASARTDIKP